MVLTTFQKRRPDLKNFQYTKYTYNTAKKLDRNSKKSLLNDAFINKIIVEIKACWPEI